MCNLEVIEWFLGHVISNPDEFNNKRILEIGSKYINGSVRPIIEKICAPREYIGIDIEEGKFVDLVLPAEKVLDYFGAETFDVIISTELLEHVKDWRIIINNMKKVLRTKGMIYITTRSYGFEYHAYPFDYWRYEESDMRKIFSDFKISEIVKQEATHPGIFVKANKIDSGVKTDLHDISLYSIAIGKRTAKISEISLKRKLMLLLRKFHLKKTVI